MDPIATFWQVTAPTLAVEWPETFKLHPSVQSDLLFHFGSSCLSIVDGDMDAPNLQNCHDIAEAIGGRVWACYIPDDGRWEARYFHDDGQWGITNPFPTANLAAIAALNQLVSELKQQRG